MGKSAVISKDKVEGKWKWGEHELPKVSNNVISNGSWDLHMKKVIISGRKRLYQLHSVISS